MAGYCAIPSGKTEDGAWPNFVRRADWVPRWDLLPGSEDETAAWTPLTPRVLHGALDRLDAAKRQMALVRLEAGLQQGCVGLLGPGAPEVRRPELRLGNHRVHAVRLDLDGFVRPLFVFHLDALQQAALVMGSPRLAWIGEEAEWSLEGPMQDGLRIQLPEAIQFAATFVD